MKLSPRQKKWTKILLILIAIRFIIGGVAYYIVAYRFRDIAQYIVNRESKGLYAFDVSDVDVSLWKRSIALKNCTLVCTDTINVTSHYAASIPQVYFSLQSVSDLLFHKKLSIDSMAVISPKIMAHSHSLNEKKSSHISFQASQIMDGLHKVVEYMQIRALNLKDVSFTYSNLKTALPFNADHINFYIKNFSKKDKRKNYLFSADDTDLSIVDQHWRLPDGIHEVIFKKFHFSGKSQYFELDSCKILVKPTTSHNGVSITTDRFFFNSKQLQDLYEKEELIIDTLTCFHPVLNMATSFKNGKGDSSAALTNAFQHLFKKMNFKYIAIKDGQVLQNGIGNGNATYGTRKADMQLYNIAINTSKKDGITTDSVKLRLNDIIFVTRDSLFQMAVGQFALDNKDLILLDAKYGPTPLNRNEKELNFAAPALHIKNISIGDLLTGRLHGTNAELVRPSIVVLDRSKISTRKPSGRGRINHFYKSLHHMHELIAVDSFNINDGSVHYARQRSSVIADIKRLNATILLHRFLKSDSLVDIKRSMPMLTMGKIDVRSPKLDLEVHDYKFQGYNRHNWANEFSLSLAKGNKIYGKELYWEIMDWDMLANHKIINIEYLKAGELKVENGSVHAIAKSKHVVKKLPSIVVGRIDVGHIIFSKKSGPENELHVTGNSICADNVQSQENYFTWRNMMGAFNDIHFTSPKVKVRVAGILFDNAQQTVVKNATVTMLGDHNKMDFVFPSAIVKSDIHSSQLKKLDLASFTINDAKVNIAIKQKERKTIEQGRFEIPVNATIGSFVVNNASVKYVAEKPVDTIKAIARVDLKIAGLHASKTETKKLTYDKAELSIADLAFNKRALDVAVASSTLTLAKGVAHSNSDHKFVMEADLLFKWAGANFTRQKNDSNILVFKKLDGYYADNAFVLQPIMQLKLQTLLARATISEGSLYYKGKKSMLNAASFNWNVVPQRLSIRDFKLMPTITRDEAFKSGNWQADYLTLSGKEIALDKIQIKHDPDDSAVTIKKITMNEVSLATARDKRLAFQHGLEKPMPTKMINSIRIPIAVDTIQVVNSHVEVHEISKITNREGVIPINNINAFITNFSNRDNENDSLAIDASAVIFDSHVRKLKYNEYYGDSLSRFSISVNLSPMHLPNLSKSVVPLASVNVDSGKSDTLFAYWVGNKYAAVGHMNFYYDKLKIRLLNPKDSAHSNLKLRVENMLANSLILRTKNARGAQTFFIRDREKFVFNYWVKTALGGLLSSVGLKSNRKYISNYEKVKVQYSLPAFQ